MKIFIWRNKSRPSEAVDTVSRPHSVRLRPVLDAASAPENHSLRQADQFGEEKTERSQDSSTPLAFRYATASAIKAEVDLSEPSTFEETVSGSNQAH